MTLYSTKYILYHDDFLVNSQQDVFIGYTHAIPTGFGNNESGTISKSLALLKYVKIYMNTTEKSENGALSGFHRTAIPDKIICS